MKISELKELMVRSLDRNNTGVEAAGSLRDAGVDFKFREGFTDRVLEKLYLHSGGIVRKMDLKKEMNNAFYRIALTGVAAIVILLISIYIVNGSFSVDSFLGIGSSSDESILYLLTGN